MPDSATFDPVLYAIDNAPVGERFTPEQEAELAAVLADVRAGRARLVPHSEVVEEARQRQAG